MNLQELIAAHKGGRSLQDLADGSRLAKSTWATHASPRSDGPTRRLPDRDTMEGIAEGLGVDVETVGLAALATLGVLPRLSRGDVETVVELIDLLADLAVAAPAQRPAPVAGGDRTAAATVEPVQEAGPGAGPLAGVLS